MSFKCWTGHTEQASVSMQWRGEDDQEKFPDYTQHITRSGAASSIRNQQQWSTREKGRKDMKMKKKLSMENLLLSWEVGACHVGWEIEISVNGERKKKFVSSSSRLCVTLARLSLINELICAADDFGEPLHLHRWNASTKSDPILSRSMFVWQQFTKFIHEGIRFH